MNTVQYYADQLGKLARQFLAWRAPPKAPEVSEDTDDDDGMDSHERWKAHLATQPPFIREQLDVEAHYANISQAATPAAGQAAIKCARIVLRALAAGHMQDIGAIWDETGIGLHPDRPDELLSFWIKAVRPYAAAHDRTVVDIPIHFEVMHVGQVCSALAERLQAAESVDSAASLHGKRRSLHRPTLETFVGKGILHDPYVGCRDLAKEFGCSPASIISTEVWRANQRRLKTAKAEGRDPKAVGLNLSAVTEAGWSKRRQRSSAKEKLSEIEEELDVKEADLQRRVSKYYKDHPGAASAEVATVCKCQPRDVDRIKRQQKKTLDRLVREQTEERGVRRADQAFDPERMPRVRKQL